MAKKTEETKTFDVQVLFSRKNEREGVWYEPELAGVPCGIKFKVLGLDADEAIIAAEEFSKEAEKADAIEDKIEKENRYEEILAKRIASIVTDIKSSEGYKLTIGGRDLSKEDIYEVIYNSPAIAVKIMDFHRSKEGFLGIKKRK